MSSPQKANPFSRRERDAPADDADDIAAVGVFFAARVLALPYADPAVHGSPPFSF